MDTLVALMLVGQILVGVFLFGLLVYLILRRIKKLSEEDFEKRDN